MIGTGVIINASTAIFDATTGEYIRANENGQIVVPAGAVVVAGSRPISKGPGAEQGVHTRARILPQEAPFQYLPHLSCHTCQE